MLSWLLLLPASELRFEVGEDSLEVPRSHHIGSWGGVLRIPFSVVFLFIQRYRDIDIDIDTDMDIDIDIDMHICIHIYICIYIYTYIIDLDG